MGKGIAALAGLPQVDFVFPAANGACSLEALRAVVRKVAQMIVEETADAAYTDIPVHGADPLHESVWDITVADSGTTFTCELVSDSNPNGGAQGRAGISSRRPIDLTKLTSVNNVSPKSMMAILNYIDRLEDLVADSGTGTTGDLTSQTISVRGNTPFETHEWTITKSDDAYTLVPTANSN